MRCQLCGWNAEHTTNLSFCPDCGSDENLSHYADEANDAYIHCYACNTMMLYWQYRAHTCG